MELDRQAIERRDFPIARRGYEPAAVDAHLRALAHEVEALMQTRGAGAGEQSLASAAGSQVQSILQAAESAAADIERDAREHAASLREAAERDATQTREQALNQARTHVAAIERATTVLLERVGSLDTEVGAMLESLRAGANRLAGDLSTLDSNMGELYDAAAGRAAAHVEPATPLTPAAEAPAPGASAEEPAPRAEPAPAGEAPPAAAGEAPAAAAGEAPAAAAGPPAATPPRQAAAPSTPSQAPPREEPFAASAAPLQSEPVARRGDIDGARLVALNMALNGERREATERYVTEHFELAEPGRLIDEVYAAIEA